MFLKRNVDERNFEIWLYVECNVLIKSLLSLQARVQQLLQINANQVNEIQNLQSVVSSNFQQCLSLFTFTVLSKRQWFSVSVLFRSFLTWTLMFEGWLELAYELFSFQPSGRGVGDARRHGRRRSLTRLFFARLLFPLTLSQAEEARETREGIEGKGDPRVSSSHVSCFHYLLAKRKRRERRAKTWKEKEIQASLPRTSPVSITF